MKVIFEGEKSGRDNDFSLNLADLGDGDGFELSDGRIGIVHWFGMLRLAIFYSEKSSQCGFNIADGRFLDYKCRRRQLRITVDPL